MERLYQLSTNKEYSDSESLRFNEKEKEYIQGLFKHSPQIFVTAMDFYIEINFIEMSIVLNKMVDEYYYLNKSKNKNQDVWSHYKCDQWDGLIQCLNDRSKLL